MSSILFGNDIVNFIHVNEKMNNKNFALPFINNIREHKKNVNENFRKYPCCICMLILIY
jgi:hypothetical protein